MRLNLRLTAKRPPHADAVRLEYELDGLDVKSLWRDTWANLALMDGFETRG